MSISGTQDLGRQRAIANITIPASSGITENIATFEATEDRTLDAIQTDLDAQVPIEISFSSTEFGLSAPSGNADVINTKSLVIVTHIGTLSLGDNWLETEAGDGIEWREGDEINIHVENNTASAVALLVNLYYEIL